MTNLRMPELADMLCIHGRTTVSDDGKALFFNWTCSGFTVRFRGKTLRARIAARGEIPPAPPTEPQLPMEYPWLGVAGDDGETLLSRFECRDADAWYTLWSADDEAEHTLRVVKLSENMRGKTGVLELETDGELLTPPQKPAFTVEYVGDSITCGYGNEAAGAASPFLPSEENGWITYAALAARKLGVEFRCVSVSGIAVSRGKKVCSPFQPMEEIYEYTDSLYDDGCGREPRAWDFSAEPADVVVLNLGTNDVNPIRFAPDYDTAMEEKDFFCERYMDFLHRLRRCNGPRTQIVCTLGSIDYYLYDEILRTVERYRAETGDERIDCFKFIGINLATEGFGAVGHPSAKTHARMAGEMARRLEPFVREKRQG